MSDSDSDLAPFTIASGIRIPVCVISWYVCLPRGGFRKQRPVSGYVLDPCHESHPLLGD